MVKCEQSGLCVKVGLLRIEEFHQARGEKLPVSLMVSVGTGTYPPKKLGSVNAQQYLYFGSQWLNLLKQQSLLEIKNLAELLSNAVCSCIRIHVLHFCILGMHAAYICLEKLYLPMYVCVYLKGTQGKNSR